MMTIEVLIDDFEMNGTKAKMIIKGKIIDKKMIDFIKSNYKNYSIKDERPVEGNLVQVNKKITEMRTLPQKGNIKSRKQVAKVLGISPGKYKKIENGLEAVSVEIAQKLGEYYNCSYQDFL